MHHRIAARTWRRLWRAYCVCGLRWPCPDRVPYESPPPAYSLGLQCPDGSWRA
jgi:hypothetical protein